MTNKSSSRKSINQFNELRIIVKRCLSFVNFLSTLHSQTVLSGTGGQRGAEWKVSNCHQCDYKGTFVITGLPASHGVVPVQHLLSQLAVLDPPRELDVSELVTQELRPQEALQRHTRHGAGRIALQNKKGSLSELPQHACFLL